MAFVKLVKNKAYFKRFQVKYRRRRQGKTDYRARKGLIIQDKNKYNSPKYRFVVRFTNKDVIAQVFYAKISGDVCLTAAYAHELPRYGVSFGLTNYAAAYATGLLLARRVLQKLKLDTQYVGKKEATGEFYLVEDPTEEGQPRPFQTFLDVGLVATTTGHRVFGALKGAVDGGLRIPHKPNRFPGFTKDAKSFDPKELRRRIFGGHVADYMRQMQDDDEEKYNAHFSTFIKAGATADKLESLYKACHAAIRKDPAAKNTTKKVPAQQVRHRPVRLTYAQRKERIEAKIAQRDAANAE